MTSDVFYELGKDHLQTAIQSDYLQVSYLSTFSEIATNCTTKQALANRFPIAQGRNTLILAANKRGEPLPGMSVQSGLFLLFLFWHMCTQASSRGSD